MVVKRIEIEGLIKLVPHVIMSLIVVSPIKVLHDIVVHNIYEINEQHQVKFNNDITKENANKDQNNTISIML